MLAQTTIETSSSGGGAAAGIIFAFYALFFIVYLVAAWKLFTKMGQPGWVGIIPILNAYAIYKLAGREGWWVILLFIPCINIIALWFLSADTAKLFGKELGWTLLLFFFTPIAWLILAFGDSRYLGPDEQII